MTGGRKVCLTLVAARQLERELLDYLSSQADLAPGFTVSAATGHGTNAELYSMAERVKGRADRVIVRIILDEPAAGPLIDRLRQTFARTRLTYWTAEVLDFGVID